MIPTTLEGWTLGAVTELLARGVFESDEFDFKEKLPDRNGHSDKVRLIKTCCSFANSTGGFLIFGVRDAKGLSLADRLVGLDSQDDFPERFGNFPAAVEPTIRWFFKNPPVRLESDRVVHVVHIPGSSRKPHGVVEDGRWWFCKRTAKGTESMSMDEICGAVLDTGRRMGEMSWLRAEVGRIRDIAERLNSQPANQKWDLATLLSRFDAGQLKTLMVSLFSYLDNGTSLVPDLHDLVERCAKLDAMLAPLAAFRMRPGDTKSYSRSGPDPLDTARAELLQIMLCSHRILDSLKQVLT